MHDWNDEIEREFFRCLKRGRQQPQYLIIQATTLVGTGRPELATAELDLVEHFAQQHYEPVFASRAFHEKARALLIFERWDEACEAFEDALAARRVMPNVIDDTWLEYPFAIARRRARDRYQRALDVLKEFMSPTALALPIQEFQYFATLALISADEGDWNGASRWARNALAASGKHSRRQRVPYGHTSCYPVAGEVLRPGVT